MNKRSLFTKRLQAKPYEYPELLKYKDAIRQSYWLHDEFNYTTDIQNFYVDINEKERTALTRSMLAISQIEVSVKRFWGDLYHYFPKPEIDLVGQTFGDSECRHFDAYANLLEFLDMNELYNTIMEQGPLKKRVTYIEKFMENKDLDSKHFTLTLVLFSLFIEHISLFGQFYTIMAFNKRKNWFKGISNAIAATSKEEELHGRFGIELFNILKTEHSEYFDDEFKTRLISLAKYSYQAEQEIIDWIFEEGDLEFLPKQEVKNFIANRYNKSLTSLGYDSSYFFPVDKEILKKTTWFDDEVMIENDNDFFSTRSITYTKRTTSITGDDLFADGQDVSNYLESLPNVSL